MTEQEKQEQFLRDHVVFLSVGGESKRLDLPVFPLANGDPGDPEPFEEATGPMPMAETLVVPEFWSDMVDANAGGEDHYPSDGPSVGVDLGVIAAVLRDAGLEGEKKSVVAMAYKRLAEFAIAASSARVAGIWRNP
jgi:hypothetical protein